MKKFLKTAWIIFCILLLFIYLLSAFSAYIAPSAFSYISLFALAFPFALGAIICCCIINFFIHKWLAFIMLCLLPAGYRNTVNTFAFRAEKQWQQQKDTNTLRVMTWNVQDFANYNRTGKSKTNYRTNRMGMLNLIRQYNPDIICFQDYKNVEHAKNPPIRKELDSLGYRYVFFSGDKISSFRNKPWVRVEEGVAIYSKQPLFDSGRININHSTESENLIYADTKLNNKPVRVFTAHLQSFGIYTDTALEHDEQENIYEITYQRRRAAAYKIRETEIKHQQEVAIIRKAIDESAHPAIYCGDLNTTPASYNYRMLRGKNLNDAFLEKGSGIGNTFYQLLPTLRIDVCLTDTAMKVLQCKRDKAELSDHYPVITDVRWK